MTPDYRALGREYGRRSRAEQGLPATLEDPATITRLRQIFRPTLRSHTAGEEVMAAPHACGAAVTSELADRRTA